MCMGYKALISIDAEYLNSKASRMWHVEYFTLGVASHMCNSLRFYDTCTTRVSQNPKLNVKILYYWNIPSLQK